MAVREELGGNVHVRHFLLVRVPGVETFAASLTPGEVVPEVGYQVAECREGIKPGILTTIVLAVPTAIPDPCRKVVAVRKLLIALEK